MVTVNESHLKSALSKVSDAVVTMDHDNNISFMNAAALALTHCPPANAAGRPVQTVLSLVDTETGGDIANAVALARELDSEPAPLHRALLLGGADLPMIIEYSVSAMRDEVGAFEGSVVVFRDITNRRHSELALQLSKESQLANAAELFVERERAQVTLNSIGDAVISTDFRGQVTFLNAIAEAMTGWKQKEAAGLPLEQIVPLISATTREPIDCPARRAIIEDSTIRLDTASVLLRKDQVEIAIEASASPIHDTSGGVAGAVMVAHDVTVARQQAEKLVRQALYDNLTGLPNRTLLRDRLGQTLERAHRSAGRAAVIFVDLDGFKPVNDAQGHAVGDRLLQEMARRLLTCVRSSDTVSRYGGDEFIIVLGDISQPEDAAVCAAKVIAAASIPFAVDGLQIRFGASAGIAHFPGDASDAATLLKYADMAMYHAKSSGRNRYQFFNRDLILEEENRRA